MKLFLVSLFIMMIYVLIKVDLKSFQLAQHGEATTGVWNGNDVGMKCALFVVVMLYFLDNNTKIIQRIIMLISMSIAVVLVYYTASILHPIAVYKTVLFISNIYPIYTPINIIIKFLIFFVGCFK